MEKQRTIKKEISVSGIGLHTGKKVNLTFKPASVDSGINFIRTDLASRPVIRAGIENSLLQGHIPRRTSIGINGVDLHTIEHLMAVLFGLGIDNIVIEIDNEEIPGLDGSGRDFLEALAKAQVVEQEKNKECYYVKEPIFIQEADAFIMVLPSADFKVSYTLSYNHPMLRAQFLELNLDSDTFRKEIVGARTFCLQEEAEELQRQGVGLGANYTNTLVVGKDGVIDNKLRFEDEFIRHKILDLLGDLYLLGEPIRGHIIALRSGHYLNLKLAKKIDQQRQRYSSGGITAAYTVDEAQELGITEIMKILPHRDPFLFVDKIVSLEKGKRIVGIKNVTINDYFFKGHFPGKPVMPGVLIVEAMAQVGGVMMLSSEENRGKIAYFMSADNVKFRKTVVPGDQLVMEVEAGKVKARTGKVHAQATVDGKVVAEADLMFALADS